MNQINQRGPGSIAPALLAVLEVAFRDLVFGLFLGIGLRFYWISRLISCADLVAQLWRR